ncbi:MULTISPECIES: hypothetical protein [unclassified Pseudodesulfovibrio]|uniref:ParB/RepB/Spo0J family partition protein n=1 Tax=unclassified Pseudodesulfovibrio TaxID=2661612 RepID=UPI000FEBD0AE|nr:MULTISPECIES: hypothetical protein [unclassified Pseudodesulfovibrio]MCJ2163139.1 hypothetical protein [Pseudodesulfovibrio sp. S3-i]RWU07131.1 hypothetical protein DWB63_01080 [Pseudodesulfovibrio sp. S3]
MLLTSEIFTASAPAIHADGAHLFWTADNHESLTVSITEFGQSAPVLVRDIGTGLELIAGASRLSILAALGRPVLARMVQDANDIDLGLLYLADNVQRPLHDAMRLQALKYFAPRMNEAALAKDILPRLGIKPQSKDGRLFLAWLNLPEAWQGLLERGNVPLAAATVLSRMSEADQEDAAPLFTGFSWSRSNAVNVLTWLFEAAKMTGTSVAEVMKQAGAAAIFAQGLSPKDAIARLSTAIRQVRYPELTRLQDRFSAASGEITASTRWRVTQPDNFETDGAELTIRIKDAAQLEKAVEDLKTMSASPAWTKIWNLGGTDD